MDEFEFESDEQPLPLPPRVNIPLSEGPGPAAISPTRANTWMSIVSSPASRLFSTAFQYLPSVGVGVGVNEGVPIENEMEKEADVDVDVDAENVPLKSQSRDIDIEDVDIDEDVDTEVTRTAETSSGVNDMNDINSNRSSISLPFDNTASNAVPFDTLADEASSMLKPEPSIARAWAYFEHITLPRYIDSTSTNTNTNTAKSTTRNSNINDSNDNPMEIDFVTEDYRTYMTNGRRIALYLSKYRWYNQGKILNKEEFGRKGTPTKPGGKQPGGKQPDSGLSSGAGAGSKPCTMRM
mmetsp:Transcript_9247/g.13389  ORF Transcript_9247/g.13389 Transcript_9247/m.13389 type:complete len:295 (+) Transcript_9247:2-886(+)